MYEGRTWRGYLAAHEYLRVSLIFIIVFLLTKYIYASRKNLPPGPWNIPLVGYMPFLGRKFHVTLTRLAQTFGSVYQVFLGSNRLVIISDPNVIRDALSRKVFTGRPNTELTKIVKGYGIVNTDGELWKEQRAFVNWALKELGAKNSGTRRSTTENNIQGEVNQFLESIYLQKGSPFKFRPIVVRSISNIIGTLLMGVRYDDKDAMFPRLLELMDEGFRLLAIAIPVNSIPVLRHFPFCNRPYEKLKRNIEETTAYFRRIVQRHYETFDSENIRDFVDLYLNPIKPFRRQQKLAYFSEQQLIQLLGDMFSAGLETVTSLLEWCVLYVTLHPQVQQRVQNELDDVVGRQRLPTIADMPNLPYTEATILETLRRANVVPLGPAHAATEDTELNSYFIPKGTHILPNIWAVHMNPDLWPEPERFQPDRFMRDGRVHIPDDFMPFAVGRRRCVGDVLTKMEVFMFLSSTLHQFHLRLPEGEFPSIDGNLAVSLTPSPYSVRAYPREPRLL